jgi:regulator of nucleoside diphosphate kinase
MLFYCGMDPASCIEKKEKIMSKSITVTVNDYKRLMGLIEFASLKEKMPEIANRLHSTLSSAKTKPQDCINNRIVTMNSRVRLQDVKTKTEAEVTITYPHEAYPRGGKISVLSEIGLALFGREEKDKVSWKAPGGVRAFEITEVIYQPEASGEYHL